MCWIVLDDIDSSSVSLIYYLINFFSNFWNQIRNKTDEFVNSFVHNPYIHGLESLKYGDSIRTYVFSNWKLREDVFNYFCVRTPPPSLID